MDPDNYPGPVALNWQVPPTGVKLVAEFDYTAASGFFWGLLASAKEWTVHIYVDQKTVWKCNNDDDTRWENGLTWNAVPVAQLNGPQPSSHFHSGPDTDVTMTIVPIH
jgi:hypothetical protein